MTTSHELMQSRGASAARAAPRPEETDLMSQMGLRIPFAKDEEIYGQEEDADLIYRVVTGAVRTSQMMSDGRRQIGGFYYPDELFGVETGERHSHGLDRSGELADPATN